jgi:hypothetical protein
MATFDELVAFRQEWIRDVLQPWCTAAGRADLLKAESEWGDIAGRVDPEATLWTWAWGRFPALVHEGLSGVDETHRVRVTLKGGRAAEGFPDGRQTERGWLVLQSESASADDALSAPILIDDIDAVERIDD